MARGANDLSDRGNRKFAAVAAAFFMAGLSSPGAVFAQSLQSPQPPKAGDETVLLEADTLTNDQENKRVSAEGGVEVRFQGRTLRADRLIYDLQAKRVRAQGNVELTDDGGVVTYAEELEVDDRLQAGVGTEIAARFEPNGVLMASSGVRRSEVETELNNAAYTPCPVCKAGPKSPTWALRARRARVDSRSGMVSYRDTVFEVKGVPVLYLPYFSHPDPNSKRRSGLLYPTVTNSSRLGASFEQPVYWAISPHQEVTVSPRFMQKQPLFVGLEYRKRFYSGDLDFTGSITKAQEFDSDGEQFGDDSFRGHLFARGLFQATDYWSWGFGIEQVSDDLYIRRYDVEDADKARGLYRTEFQRLINQLFLVGQDERSFASVSLLNFRGLRDGDNDSAFPRVSPLIDAYRYYRDPILDGRVRLSLSTAALTRDEGFDSIRGSVGADWDATKILGPGVMVTPFAQVRSDYYQIKEFPAADSPDETVTRTVGLAGVEMRWPFVRSSGSSRIIVEPIVVAAAGPENQNKSAIPNEDGIAFEMDDSSLLRPNAAPNYDLWEGGSRVAAAVRASSQFGKSSSASVLFGRRWRSEADQAFNRLSNLDGKESDYVASLTAKLGPNLQTTARARFDSDTFDIARVDLAAQAQIWRLNGAVRYFDVNPDLIANSAQFPPTEEISGDVGFKLNRNWSVGYGLQRDLARKVNLRQTGYLTFSDECTFLELSYVRRDTFDRVIGQDDSFRLRIGLATLGVFGRSR